MDEIVVASVRSDSVITGKVGDVNIEMMLDSGSHRSLLHVLCQDALVGMRGMSKANLLVHPNLVTASGQPLPMVDHIEATMLIGQLRVRHNFLVVESLVTPAILGTDFLQKHGLTLDFTVTPVAVY